MAKKPKLELVGSSAVNPDGPPASLGKAGATLWRMIMNEYQITDSGGTTLLEQACAAVDGIAECDACPAEIIGPQHSHPPRA